MNWAERKLQIGSRDLLLSVLSTPQVAHEHLKRGIILSVGREVEELLEIRGLGSLRPGDLVYFASCASFLDNWTAVLPYDYVRLHERSEDFELVTHDQPRAAGDPQQTHVKGEPCVICESPLTLGEGLFSKDEFLRRVREALLRIPTTKSEADELLRIVESVPQEKGR